MGRMKDIRLLDRIPLPWRKWRVVLTVAAADDVPQRLPRRGAALVMRGEQPTWIAFDCPCSDHHRLLVNLDPARSPTWALAGSSPLTLSPSIDDVGGARRCHYFIRGGKIRWAHD